MSKAWRFVKWYVAKTSWSEYVMFIAWGAFVFGIAAKEGVAKDAALILALTIAAGAILKFLWWGVREVWSDFKKHDNQVFEILKKDDIK